MRKVIAILLTVVLSLSIGTTALATSVLTDEAVSVQTQRFTAINSISAELSIDSGGKAVCIGRVTPQQSSYTSYLQVQLGKFVNGNWQALYTWSDSATGLAGVIIKGERYVTSGDYYVRVEAKIYDSSYSLLETVVRFSPMVSY